jgi:23S rRNA (uracil1939-C5)-methyltransferase
MGESIVKIEKMAFGGSGFGHLDGKACFVPFTAPGDVVRIRVKVEKRSYLEGEPAEILEASPLRVTPPCPVFGSCGGCNWQHLSYPDQLVVKEEIFTDILWRSGRVARERIGPVLPAPEPFGYRSRIQLKISFSEGVLHMGFYRAGSHFVVGIPGRCQIADPRINAVLDGLRRLVAHAPEPEKIPQIDAAVGEEGGVELVIHYSGNRRDETAGYLAGNSHLSGVDTIFLQTGGKYTIEKIGEVNSGTLSYMVPDQYSPASPGYRLEISSGGFSQVNYRQNLMLIETVCDWAELSGKERVLDIYCGNGNFSLPLAVKAANLLGVEDYGPSIAYARRNCAANGLTNVTFECIDALVAMDRLVSREETYDLVILDPPRTGAKDVAAKLHALRPASIIYVSCDPATLARDIGILKKSGYDVVKSRPVDMFPQTYHVESVTLLRKQGQEPWDDRL